MFQNRMLRFILLSLAVGCASEYFLWQNKENVFLLILMAPVLATAILIETHLAVGASLSALQSELFFVLPGTLLYFGLFGFWLGQILKEEGFWKYFVLLSFLVFIAVLHWQGFEYVGTFVLAP